MVNPCLDVGLVDFGWTGLVPPIIYRQLHVELCVCATRHQAKDGLTAISNPFPLFVSKRRERIQE